MRTILTRAIIRQLIRNEPLHFRGCLYRSSITPLFNNKQSHWTQSPRRSFVRALFPYPRGPTERRPSAEAKFNFLQEICKKQDMRVRMPDTPEIAKAWETFLEEKLALKEKVTDVHTIYLLRIYNLLRKRETIDNKSYLDPATCRLALSALRVVPDAVNNRVSRVDQSFPNLATALYRVVEAEHPPTAGVIHVELVSPLLTLVQALSCSGHSGEARDELTRYLGQEGQSDLTPHWREVVKGFANEKDIAGLRDTASLLKTKKPQLYADIRELLLEKYAQLDAMEETSTMFFEIAESMQLNAHTYKVVFFACARNKDLDLGHSLVRTITELGATSRPAYCGLVFLWALDSGRSIQDIERMFKVMQQHNPDLKPNTSLVEIILDSYIATQDPYLTERILQLSYKWGVTPNNWIWKRIVDSRLLAGDVEGAFAAYHEIENQVEPIPWQRDRCLNKIITAMINSRKYEFERIMTVVEELNSRGGEFQLETITTLTKLHLLRQEYHEVVDLLKTHIPNLFVEERIKLRDLCVELCLDRRNKIANCWDIYMIFHQILDRETDRTVRTRIMREFIARRRPDMAVYVFNHMRDHWREDTMATIDTYIDIFVGLARHPDRDALYSVNNQLKLDLNIDPTTRLYNALMLAFVESPEPRQALPFWREIVSGPEGPDHNSVQIIFQVCEKIPFGDEFAAVVWNQLQTANIETTPEMVIGYIGALSANDNVDAAKQIIAEWGRDFTAKAGLDYEVQLLGTFLSTIRLLETQEAMEKWAEEMYPVAFAELQKRGFKKLLGGTKVYKINRQLNP